jgi:hypothetical protein
MCSSLFVCFDADTYSYFSHGKCCFTFLASTNRTSVLVNMIVIHDQEREVTTVTTTTTRMSDMLLIVVVVIAVHDRV